VVEEWARVLVQWLHVTAGVLWIGGGSYTLFVQLPGMMAAPPEARGPVMAQLGPRQVSYLLRVAELTLATGVLQLIVTGRAGELTAPLGSRWAGSILLGIVGAVAIYALIRAVAQPTLLKLLDAGRRAAAGDAEARTQTPLLVARIRSVAQVQIGIGFAVLLVMVLARFS